MRRQTVIALAGAVALAIGGCGGEPEAEVTQSPSPVASPSPTQPASPAPAASPGATKDPFTQPLTAQAPNQVPGLIQPTKADERAKEIERRISDNRRQQGTTTNALGTTARANPFATVPLKTTSTTPITEVVPDLPLPPRALTSPFTAFPTPPVALRPPAAPARPGSPTPPRRRPTTPQPPAARGPLPPTATRPTPPLPSAPAGTRPGDTAIVPPRPSTTLADAIVVTGVVQVDGKIFAIVQEANRPSAYVRAGQRLANGLVLVKRIEISPGGEPLVVLEQNGVEVTKVVGEGASPIAPAGTTT